jgi:thiamine-phosphate diphosphorylase
MTAHRPLPRLHAITDGAIRVRDDVGRRAAAIAAAGPAVALHARDRGASGATLRAFAERLGALARPPEAALFVNARADVAAIAGAHGVQLGPDDLAPGDARRVFAAGWIGRSVHSAEEAIAARDEGADYLLAGHVYDTPSHPDEPSRGPTLVEQAARTGLPVIAIGGVTAERARELRDAGAWGVAAIRALWDAADPAAAALALLAPWSADA